MSLQACRPQWLRHEGVWRNAATVAFTNPASHLPLSTAPCACCACCLQFGVVPITHMRAFQKAGRLPDDLVADIQSRHSAAA